MDSIELEKKYGMLLEMVIEGRANLNNMITIQREHSEQDFRRHEDHEHRLRFLEQSTWIGIGALAFMQVVFKFFIK